MKEALGVAMEKYDDFEGPVIMSVEVQGDGIEIEREGEPLSQVNDHWDVWSQRSQQDWCRGRRRPRRHHRGGVATRMKILRRRLVEIERELAELRKQKALRPRGGWHGPGGCVKQSGMTKWP